MVFTNHVETKKHFAVRYFAPTFGCPNVGPPFCSRFAFLSFVSTCWTYIFVAERILPKFSPRSNRSNLNLYRMLHLLNGLLTGAYRVRVHKQYFEKNLQQKKCAFHVIQLFIAGSLWCEGSGKSATDQAAISACDKRLQRLQRPAGWLVVDS